MKETYKMGEFIKCKESEVKGMLKTLNDKGYHAVRAGLHWIKITAVPKNH